MEYFVTVVNGWIQLNNVTKSHSLDFEFWKCPIASRYISLCRLHFYKNGLNGRHFSKILQTSLKQATKRVLCKNWCSAKWLFCTVLKQMWNSSSLVKMQALIPQIPKINLYYSLFNRVVENLFSRTGFIGCFQHFLLDHVFHVLYA